MAKPEELEERKVVALEKIANTLDALTLWFEDIDTEELEYTEDEPVIATPRPKVKTKNVIKKKKQPRIIYEESSDSETSESEEYIIRRVRKTKKQKPKPVEQPIKQKPVEQKPVEQPTEIEQYEEPQQPQRDERWNERQRRLYAQMFGSNL